MREPGIPNLLLRWRWAPCAALALGALSFCAFALLAIPDHIEGLESGASSANLRLGNQLSRVQTTPLGAADFSSNATSASDEDQASGASTVTQLATRASASFPKRGFTPPLDRPEPPPGAGAATPPVPAPVPPPAEAPAPAAPEATDAPAPLEPDPATAAAQTDAAPVAQ